MKVTLLGDSIREQYCPRVEKLLGDEFEVWSPEENCRFSKYTLRGLFDWATDMHDSKIVHWNNGLWDLCHLFDDGTFTSDGEYVETILRIADILKKRYGIVIFATTTPVRYNNIYNNNEDIDRINKLIVPLLKERGVIINDLNTLLRSDIERYICDDTIHLSEEAIDICAVQVAEHIKAAAKNITSVSNEHALQYNGSSSDNTGAPVLL